MYTVISRLDALSGRVVMDLLVGRDGHPEMMVHRDNGGNDDNESSVVMVIMSMMVVMMVVVIIYGSLFLAIMMAHREPAAPREASPYSVRMVHT